MSARDVELARARVAARKAAGQCIQCGHGPVQGTRCETCAAKHRANQEAYEAKRPPRLDRRTPPAARVWCDECIACGFHRHDCPAQDGAP